MGELQFELWAAGVLIVEFQGAQYLRATALRVLKVATGASARGKRRKPEESRTLKQANAFCDCVASALECMLMKVD